MTAGTIAAYRGHYRRSSQAYEEFLKLPREHVDPLLLAYALNNLGWAANLQGKYSRAMTQLKQGLTIFRSVQHSIGVVVALDNLGDAKRHQGDYAAAMRDYEEGLELCRQIGDTRGIGGALLSLGHVSREQGRSDDAEQNYARSVEIFKQIGARLRQAEALVYLGHAIWQHGEASRARFQYLQALQILRESPVAWETAVCLEGVAAIAVGDGRPARAARLSAAAAALREQLSMPPHPFERALVAQTVEQTRAALTTHGFASAWTRGRSLPIEAVIAEALQETGAEPAGDAASTGPAPERVTAPLRVVPQPDSHNGADG